MSARVDAPAGEVAKMKKGGADPLVRADLRDKYKRHPWPEDPANATPTKMTNRALAKPKALTWGALYRLLSRVAKSYHHPKDFAMRCSATAALEKKNPRSMSLRW